MAGVEWGLRAGSPGVNAGSVFNGGAGRVGGGSTSAPSAPLSPLEKLLRSPRRPSGLPFAGRPGVLGQIELIRLLGGQVPGGFDMRGPGRVVGPLTRPYGLGRVAQRTLLRTAAKAALGRVPVADLLWLLLESMETTANNPTSGPWPPRFGMANVIAHILAGSPAPGTMGIRQSNVVVHNPAADSDYLVDMNVEGFVPSISGPRPAFLYLGLEADVYPYAGPGRKAAPFAAPGLMPLPRPHEAPFPAWRTMSRTLFDAQASIRVKTSPSKVSVYDGPPPRVSVAERELKDMSRSKVLKALVAAYDAHEIAVLFDDLWEAIMDGDLDRAAQILILHKVEDLIVQGFISWRREAGWSFHRYVDQATGFRISKGKW